MHRLLRLPRALRPPQRRHRDSVRSTKRAGRGRRSSGGREARPRAVHGELDRAREDGGRSPGCLVCGRQRAGRGPRRLRACAQGNGGRSRHGPRGGTTHGFEGRPRGRVLWSTAALCGRPRAVRPAGRADREGARAPRARHRRRRRVRGRAPGPPRRRGREDARAGGALLRARRARARQARTPRRRARKRTGSMARPVSARPRARGLRCAAPGALARARPRPGRVRTPARGRALLRSRWALAGDDAGHRARDCRSTPRRSRLVGRRHDCHRLCVEHALVREARRGHGPRSRDRRHARARRGRTGRAARRR